MILHDTLGFPNNGIGVEISCRIEPEIELLLPVALPLSKHISVEDVRFTGEVP